MITITSSPIECVIATVPARIVGKVFFFLQIFWPVPKFEIIFFGLRQFRWLKERLKQNPNHIFLILAAMTQWILGFEVGTEVANLANLQKIP